jgi:Fe-S cluster assembly protein SufD
VTSKEAFLAAFGDFDRQGLGGGPAWLREARRASIARFAEVGLPTPRDEEWKYTSTAALDAALRVRFELDGTPDALAPEALDALVAGAPSGPRLVFVEGRYSAKLSAALGPGHGRLSSLGEAVLTDGEIVRRALDRQSTDLVDGFAALNGAFWLDGAFVHVPAGVVVAEPIHLIFVGTSSEAGSVAHLRNVISLGRGSQATVVESYVSLGDEPSLTNAMTEVIIDDSARFDHCKIERESAGVFHVGRMAVRQARDSQLASSTVTFGSRLARHDLHVLLDAEGASCALTGLYVVGGRQHVDHHTVVEHAKPHGTSRQLYKGVLDGHARGVFNGRVIVRPGAQKTDAHQTNKNLLLSEGAEVDSKPQLEIFADDVKCSHGAADGQLAPDALLYLKSRGLGDEGARALLTYGFASEVLARIGSEALRAWLEALLTARLHRGRVSGTSA